MTPVRPTRPQVPCRIAGVALVVFFALAGAVAQAQTDVADLGAKLDQLDSTVERQGPLRESIDQANAEINGLIGRESELRRREAAAQTELDQRNAELSRAAAKLAAEQEHLQQLREHLRRAQEQLAGFLVQIYKSGQPDTLSVLVNASSWDEVLSQSEYLQRIDGYQSTVVGRVRDLREESQQTVASLDSLRQQIETVRDAAAKRRDEVRAVRSELTERHQELLAARRARQSDLEALLAREKSLEKELGTNVPSAGERASLFGQRAVAPADAPLQVKAVIDAANQISDLPYVWGGGHGSFSDSGYDCSGAVSFALNGGGLLDSPLDSSAFMVYASPGAGNWITIYAQGGHMYAVIAGLRFDTGGPGGGNGPRWSTVQRSPAGFVARHPAGL